MPDLIIGLDIGYGHTKWTTDGKIVHDIPSVVTTTSIRDFDSDFPVNPKGYRDLAVQWDGRTYLVGEMAMREDAQATRVITPDRTIGAEFQVLLGTTILAEQKDQEPITIHTGLPYNARRESLQRLKVELLNKKEPMTGESGAVKGRSWNGTMDQAYVFRQAQAMIFDAVFENINGQIKPVRDHELITVEGTRAAVVDIGYKTTDVIVCEVLPEFKIIRELSFTLPLAVGNIGKRVQEEFQRITRSEETTLDIRRLDQAVKQGKIPHSGKILDLTVARDRAVHDVATQLMNQVFEKWGKALTSIHVVYLGGGGAELLGPILKRNLHENVYNIPKPQGSNARGYFKMQYFH